MKINKNSTRKTVINLLSFISILFSLGFTTPYFISTNSQTIEWVAPPETNKIKNPLAGDIKSIDAGKALYNIYCVPCHGEKGKGDGPASLSIKTKPADHTSEKIQNQSDGAIFWKLTEGRTDNVMVSYKSILSDTERWSLVNFIRTLAVK